jgi:hypothetical protein
MEMSRTVFVRSFVLLMLVAPLALAQQPQTHLEAGAQRPWSQGVPKENQEAAAKLFFEANEYLQKNVFGKAAELYRQALTHWDHPAIHYNLSLALMDTGLLLEFREHLVGATRYGRDPLDKEMFEHAGRLKLFVEGQLVHVEVSCDVAGASVSMDGKALFTAPGYYEGWVLPGSHVFVTTQPGHSPNERIRTPAAGEKISLHISKLYEDEELTRYRRRWSAWKPWTVLGAGAALAAGGGLLHLRARDNYRRFDAQATACGLAGCAPTPELGDLRKRGDTFQKVAVGGYAAGGALFATGAVLAFMNRAQPYRLSPDEHEQVTSLAVGGAGGAREVLLTIRF